jgi:hypothetical protein
MIKHAKYLLIFWILCILQCKASMVLFPEIDQGNNNWLKKETVHFHIYYRPDSEAEKNIETISSYLDRKFIEILEILQVEYENKINFIIYDSPEDLKKHVYEKTWGFAVGEYEAVALYYPSKTEYESRLGRFAHEVVHIIVYWTVGIRGSDFLNEGIAETIEKYSILSIIPPKLWIHYKASTLMKNGKLLSIKQLSDNEFFKDIRDSRELYYTYYLYDQCGSLVRYLIDQYGIEKFKRFFAKADEDNYKTIFQYIYGKSIDEFEEEWHEFLRNY